MGYLAEYKGQKFVCEGRHGVGPMPTPNPAPVKLDASRPWANDWPVVQTRFVSAGQHWQSYDLADYL
jgi:hypothetical protein